MEKIEQRLESLRYKFKSGNLPSNQTEIDKMYAEVADLTIRGLKEIYAIGTPKEISQYAGHIAGDVGQLLMQKNEDPKCRAVGHKLMTLALINAKIREAHSVVGMYYLSMGSYTKAAEARKKAKEELSQNACELSEESFIALAERNDSLMKERVGKFIQRVEKNPHLFSIRSRV